jgi:anthranilate phosphoribosyltransferase
MLKETIEQLIAGDDLSTEQAEDAMRKIMSGAASDAEIGGFLVAMRMRTETPQQIEGFARVMRENCVPIEARSDDLVDTCGTGGDSMQTFNISTVSGIVAAGAGVKVAKHGNRSVSSKCGSADVLAELGVNIDCSTEQVAQCIDACGIGFLFAPNLHPAMRYAIGPRRSLGIRTVFNILGPLTNPAGASRQLLGVFAPELTETLAATLGRLGSVHALVVHGLDGIDELSTVGPTRVSELVDGAVETYQITPEQFGFARVEPEDIAGGEPAENAAIVLEILEGKQGPHRDIAVLNAGAAIYVSGHAEAIEDGITRAGEAIENGSAMNVLEQLRVMSRSDGGGDDDVDTD